MKHLNQINAALVIIGLGVVFYSLSQTFFSNQASPIQILSQAENPELGESAGALPEASPVDSRNSRTTPITPIRPATRDAGTDSGRRNLPASGSPQIFSNPDDARLRQADPNRSPARILTTPSPAVRRDDELSGSSGRGRETGEDQAQDFREAVQRMREQGGVPRRPGSSVNPRDPEEPNGGTPDQGRRRQTNPPPARSSMSSQRPPL